MYLFDTVGAGVGRDASSRPRRSRASRREPTCLRLPGASWCLVSPLQTKPGETTAFPTYTL